jgi:hypothetical protein
MDVTRFEILVQVDRDGTGLAWHPAGEADAGDVWSLELPPGARRIVVRPASVRPASVRPASERRVSDPREPRTVPSRPRAAAGPTPARGERHSAGERPVLGESVAAGTRDGG